jgi:hypothetical protein
MRFMLGELDGEQVSYNEAMFAIRRLAGEGMRFRPKPGEILGAVRSVRGVKSSVAPVRRAEWVRQLESIAGVYGREMALAFHDPHGLRSKWVPKQLPGRDREQFGRARKLMVELGAMRHDEHPITGKKVAT